MTVVYSFNPICDCIRCILFLSLFNLYFCKELVLHRVKGCSDMCCVVVKGSEYS